MDGAVREFEVPAAAREDAAERERLFAALIDRNARVMYRVAYSLLRNAEDAEDTVQETLLKLLRSGGWQGLHDEPAFLARAVWRVGLNRLAAAGARAMRYAADAGELDLVSPGLTPEEHALGAAERALMTRLIEELPEEFRQTLLLSAIEEMRAGQVAAILGIAEATVRTRLLRARGELRRRYLELTVARTGTVVAPPAAVQPGKEAR